MKQSTTYRGLAIAASPDLQDDVLQQFLASPKFERLLDDVLGRDEEEEGERMSGDRWDGC